jgi:assimilatory nitrate reductase catalytic subunit
LPLPGAAKPDWWIIKEVAARMGWSAAFAYDGPADIFREHARLSAYRNGGSRLFDIGAHAAIGNDDYDAMQPFRWGGVPFADGHFPTANGKARLIAVKQAPLVDPQPAWPFNLNTGRYRDQWHTMTRTGLSPKLARHREEPLVEVHPADGERYGLADGDIARLSSAQGESLFRVRLHDGQRIGEIFAPIHWTDRQATGGRTGLLPRPLTDPHSGQPGFKSTPVRLEKVALDWRGFLIVRGNGPDHIPALWATKVTVAGGTLYELAGVGDAAALDRYLPPGERIDASDIARGSRRTAILEQGRLSAILFVARDGALPSRDWLIAQLWESHVTPAILAGRPPGPQADPGAIVCACFDVGAKTIAAAIGEHGLADVAAIGKLLRAGTNCGSCRPALAQILAASAQPSLEKIHAAE